MIYLFLVLSILQIIGFFVFKNTEELFLGGAILYDNILLTLSLAYISSWIFYIIVEWYPNKIRKNIASPIIAVRLYRLVSDYKSFLLEVGILTEQVSEEELANKINTIDLKSEAPIIVGEDEEGNPKMGNWLDKMMHINGRREIITKELLNSFNNYLPSQIVYYLLKVQESTLFAMSFRGYDLVYPALYNKKDVSYLLGSSLGGVEGFYNYYLYISELDKLRNKFFPLKEREDFSD